MSWGKIDPDWYIAQPALSLDLFLYLSKEEIELLSSLDMYHFFERSVRGKKN